MEDEVFYNVYITYPRQFHKLQVDEKNKIRAHIINSVKKNCSSDEEWAQSHPEISIQDLSFNKKALVYFGSSKAKALVISQKFKCDNINSYVEKETYHYKQPTGDINGN
jgi:hypothetical protein